jgi:RNA polymerase II subunit A small phosphatase-like protein
LGIFTAGLQPYADGVIDRIDPGHHIKFRLFRNHCTEFGGAYVKDLGRLNRDIERIIIVDNSPFAYLRHPYNALPVDSWYEDKSDTGLQPVIDLLKVSYRVRSVYDVLPFD